MFVLTMSMNKKYFVAIIPPSTVFKKIENIKSDIAQEFKIKGALRSPAHITLHRPFEWKEGKENELLEKLQVFSFKKNFKIELKGYNTFSPRVVFIDVMKTDELTDLHYLFSGYAKRELGLLNEVNDLRGFHPHVTIAFRDLKKQQFYKLWEKYQKLDFSASFNYQGLSLLCLEKKWEKIAYFPI